MKAYVITDCTAEKSYSPMIFTGEDAESRARAKFEDLYYLYTADEELVKESSYSETCAKIIYTDNKYDVLEFFEVETH